MNPIPLFIGTIEDLEARIKPGTEYDLVRASGLLRQLLLDEKPLIHLVNRQTKQKLYFERKKWPDSNPEIGKLQLQSPEPDDQIPRIKVGLDPFLSTVVLLYHQHAYTIKDIIKTIGNIQGGVHKDEPKQNKDACLEGEQFTSFKFGMENSTSMDMAKLLIKPIAKVTLRAVYPIRSVLPAGNGR
jgi:hypothetical protein